MEVATLLDREAVGEPVYRIRYSAPQLRRHIKGDGPTGAIGPQLSEAGSFLVDSRAVAPRREGIETFPVPCPAKLGFIDPRQRLADRAVNTVP